MLSCETSYEFYITSAYALDWHLQPDNGFRSRVLGAKQSDETEYPGAIIYMDTKMADVPVVWRVQNVDGKIVKTALVLLNSNNVPMDLWVFDTIVVVKMRDGSFAFYEKPQVLGMNKDPLVGNIVSTDATLP